MRRLKTVQGQTMVETAIALPLLLFLILGIFEFGRAMYIKNTLTNAARAGARAAVVTPGLTPTSFDCKTPDDSIEYAVCDAIFSIPNKDKTGEIAASVAITRNGVAQSNAVIGDVVTISVGWSNFQPMTFSLAEMNLNITNTLGGRASMRYE